MNEQQQLGITLLPFGVTTINTTVQSSWFLMEGDAMCRLQETSDLESLRVNMKKFVAGPELTDWKTLPNWLNACQSVGRNRGKKQI